MELMGTTSQGEGEEKSEVDLSRDDSLLRVLDRLILYLRVVHSLDYYNGSDYPYEDEMPNRCGIIHVRGATPDKCALAEGIISLNTSIVKITYLTQSAIKRFKVEYFVRLNRTSSIIIKYGC